MCYYNFGIKRCPHIKHEIDNMAVRLEKTGNYYCGSMFQIKNKDIPKGSLELFL